MKTIILFAVACASAFAGTLTDSANIFGPRAPYVRTALGDSPVWIETLERPPSEGLKAYADEQVKAKTEKGFYVVITTNPREWRVSMNPVGLASSEGVRLAGDRMVTQFKRGEFSDGAIRLTQDLTRLAGMAKPTPRTVTRREVPPPAEPDYTWYWAGGIALGVLGVVGFGVWLARRSERLERERRERWAATSAKTETNRAGGVTAFGRNTRQEEAQSVFNSYTPQQRADLIRENHHHHYSSGASTDPLMFWMMLNASQPHYYSPGYIPLYEAPRHSTPTPTPEPERRRESSSDSYTPPSSYDSGGSSFDSGGSSSSDASGGGGSW